jgi:polysaccharide export outer membrane protein
MRSVTLLFPFILIFFCFSNPDLLIAEDERETVDLSADYLLGPEDTLEVSVWKDDALTRQVIVRPDGKVSFPLIGDVAAQGLTVEELRLSIQDRIKEYVPDAPVTVMVLQLGHPKVYVVGQVARPGVYVMGQPLTVLQVLAVAGGLREWAKKGDIIIVRREKGGQRAIQFDYRKVSAGKGLEQNIVLEPGDTIVVP